MDISSKKCLIIVGGEYAPFMTDIHFDYVIACDKGYQYAERMGITYDEVIGDFDSATDLPNTDKPITRLPKEKDDTDTLFAVRYALKQGFNDIYIICAFGGRLDHTLANIQVGKFIAENGASAHLYGINNEVHCFKDTSFSIKKKENSFLSVLSLSDSCKGVSISGAKYEIDHYDMSNSFPIGVSNEWEKEYVTVTVKNGVLALIISSEG